MGNTEDRLTEDYGRLGITLSAARRAGRDSWFGDATTEDEVPVLSAAGTSGPGVLEELRFGLDDIANGTSWFFRGNLEEFVAAQRALCHAPPPGYSTRAPLHARRRT